MALESKDISFIHPSVFFEKQYNIGISDIDLIKLYGTAISPFFYLAFCSWRDIIRLRGNEEVVHIIETAPEAKLIDHLHRIKLLLGYNIIPSPQRDFVPLELYYTFPTQIHGYKIPEKQSETKQILGAWAALMSRKGSFVGSISEQAPYIIDLSEFPPTIVSFLPKTIVMADYPLIRLMDSFYAPDKKGADWSEELFTYLGPDRYEAMADLELKKEIDKLLLDDLKGNVFDIGCGSGLLQKWVQEWGIDDIVLFGIDISEKMLQVAQTRNQRVVQGNAALMNPQEILNKFKKVGYKINFFNHVIMSYVDNWLTHDERVAIFYNVYQLITIGGQFNFNVYDLTQGWEKYYTELLKQAGFSKTNCSSQTLKARDGERLVGFVFAEK